MHHGKGACVAVLESGNDYRRTLNPTSAEWKQGCREVRSKSQRTFLDPRRADISPGLEFFETIQHRKYLNRAHGGQHVRIMAESSPKSATLVLASKDESRDSISRKIIQAGEVLSRPE